MTWRAIWVTYFVAHTGKSLLWSASDLMTLYVLVSHYAIAPAVAAAIFLTGMATSALADLLVGLWLEQRPTDAARVAGTGLFLAGVAFPATMLSASSGPGVLLAATIAFRISYAGCDVPHNALLGRLASDSLDAVALSRARTLGTGIAAVAAACGLAVRTSAGITPILWVIAGAATLLGAAMVPLLMAYPPLGRGDSEHRTARVPWRFLTASVIGMVALGGLGKALLHLPEVAAAGEGATTLALLIVGRTAAAFAPLRLSSKQEAFATLAAAYAASALLPLLFVLATSWHVAALLLGFAMGLTNLAGWSLLPMLAQGPRSYGIYTMASKLALGATGLVLAGGLGRSTVFTAAGLPVWAACVGAACMIAAWICLTCRPLRVVPS